MIRTGKQALELLRRQKVLPMTPVAGFHSLVGEVAGGPVRGSWWGHPKGGLMYDLANLLHNSKEVLATKFIEGKNTFIHRSLWPALFRIVSDPGRRRALDRRFSALERRILSAVESAGELEAERLMFRWEITRKADRKNFKKATDRLAAAMALLTSNVHTDDGHHASVLTSWSRRLSGSVRKSAGRIPFDAAVKTLMESCGGNLYGLSL